jgi:hypothetical protein
VEANDLYEVNKNVKCLKCGGKGAIQHYARYYPSGLGDNVDEFGVIMKRIGILYGYEHPQKYGTLLTYHTHYVGTSFVRGCVSFCLCWIEKNVFRVKFYTITFNATPDATAASATRTSLMCGASK